MEFAKNLKNGSTLREVARFWDSLGPASSNRAEPNPKLSQTGATFREPILAEFRDFKISQELKFGSISANLYLADKKRRQFVYVPESDQIEKSGLSKKSRF